MSSGPRRPGGARYWRLNRSVDYGALNGVARHQTDSQLIAER